MRGLVVLSARTCPRAVHGLVVDHGVQLHRAPSVGAPRWLTFASKKLHLTNRQTHTNSKGLWRNRQIEGHAKRISKDFYVYISTLYLCARETASKVAAFLSFWPK